MANLVSVIIVNYNSGELLKHCLACLEKQSFKYFDVAVIDNNSIDNSLDCVHDYPGVNVIKLASNIGFASANNVCISEAKSEYIALLNPDAFPDSDWLYNLVQTAIRNPDYSAFGSRQLAVYDSSKLDGIGDVFHVSGKVWREGLGRCQNSKDLLTREIFSPCAAAALYRRQAIVEIGCFDEDFFCYVEDVDLGFRLRLAGYKAMYVPEAVVHHVGSATTGGSRSDFSIYHGHRNLVWCFVKNMPGILFWLFLPLHIVLNVATVIWFGVTGRVGVILKAKRDALAGLPRMWKKRRIIQAQRRASVADIWRVLNKGFVICTQCNPFK